MISGLRKLLSLVEPALRRQWLSLLPLSALCAALEAVGAVAVYGLIRLIGDPSAAQSIPTRKVVAPSNIVLSVFMSELRLGKGVARPDGRATRGLLVERFQTGDLGFLVVGKSV